MPSKQIILSVTDSPSTSEVWKSAQEAIRKQLQIRCDTCVHWGRATDGKKFCNVHQIWTTRNHWCEEWKERV